MSAPSYDDRRRPVIYRGERVPGLYERRDRDGSTAYELRRKVDGKAVRRTLTATTATDAIAEARRVAVKVEDERSMIGSPTVTLAELRDAFAEWSSSRASTLAGSTRELYMLRLDRHTLRLLGARTRAADVTPAHLRSMIDRLRVEGASSSSVRGVIVATSALFRFAVRRGIVATNPVRLLERGDRPSGKRTTEPRYLDRSQIDRLLDALGQEYRPIAAVLAFAGLRVSEALALRWRDVDLRGGMLNVAGTKTAASSVPVPLAADLAAELQAHRSTLASRDLQHTRPDALLFTQSRRNVLRAINHAGDAAGLNPEGVERIGCHDLRHSCAGLLFAAGVTAPTVAAMLRHSDTRVTLTTYAGLVETDRAGLRRELDAALGNGGRA
jgi:integrase